jgi:hypothetical protein
LAIEKAEFDKGKVARSLRDRILEFLMINSDKAYLEVEITRQMLEVDPVMKTLTAVAMQVFVLATLENLVAEGKIVAKVPGTMPYYMYVQIGAASEGTESESQESQGIDTPKPAAATSAPHTNKGNKQVES